MVIDLGHLKITSDPEQERIVSTKVLVEFSFCRKEIESRWKSFTKVAANERQLQQVFVPICPVKGINELKIVDISVV